MLREIGLENPVKMGEGGAVLKPRATQPLMSAKPTFRKAMVAWFEAHQKDYPWRRTHDPYEVLVSEVMLQQTQIATVLGKGYYTRFLTAFPTVESLAAADDAPLLKAWEGLGYYRRVRMLRDTARAVVEQHGGEFPADLGELLKLPGIGKYTSGALRAFAFGLPAVLVDGNVSRVLSRLMNDDAPIDDGAGIKRVWEWAEALADDQHPRTYHAALMELGQQVCRPGVPDCLSCPVSAHCAASEPELLPVKKKKVPVTAVTEQAIWCQNSAGQILMHQESGKRRTGLWKLPVRQPAEVEMLPVVAEQQYAITRYRVSLRVHDASAVELSQVAHDGDAWIESDEVPELAMAAPFRKVVERLLEVREN